ncbi:MAG: hypothetical protein IPM00_10150 [Tetrasphaera sp.]|nr:hypothetical protein [Tetrasphaera sp.]
MDLGVLEAVPDLLEALDLAVRTLADFWFISGVGTVTHLALGVGLGTLGPRAARSSSCFLARVSISGVATVLDLHLLDLDLRLERGQVGVPLLLVDAGDHVGGGSR